MIGRQPAPGELHVADDRHQDVVEVVGDPPGHRAEALQPLRADHLRLEPFALGDVAVDAQDRPGLAPVLQQGPVALDDDRLPRPGDVGQLARPLTRLPHVPLGAFELSAVVVAVVQEVPHVAAQRLRAGPAVQPFGALVPVVDHPVEVTDHDGVLGLVQQRRLGEQPLLGRAALGDVVDGPHQAGAHPRRVEQGGHRDLAVAGPGRIGRSFVPAHGPALRDCPPVVGHDHRQRRLGDHVAHHLAHHLVLAHAGDLEEGRVHRQEAEPAVGLDADVKDDVRDGVVHQRAQPLARADGLHPAAARSRSRS